MPVAELGRAASIPGRSGGRYQRAEAVGTHHSVTVTGGGGNPSPPFMSDLRHRSPVAAATHTLPVPAHAPCPGPLSAQNLLAHSCAV